MSTYEEVPRGEGFESWALQELVRLGEVIRALEEGLEEVARIADDRLEEIIGVRDSLNYLDRPPAGQGAHRTGTGTASAGALRVVTGAAGETDSVAR